MTEIKSILLAEDDVMDAKLILETLAEHGLAAQVTIAQDGAEALDYLRRRGSFASRTDPNPVVVILDLKMPKVDGIEVLRQMRSEEGLKLIPVVILTSSRESRDLNAAYRSGTNAYVVKPIDFKEFSEAVKEIGLFWALLNEPPAESAGKAV